MKKGSIKRVWCLSCINDRPPTIKKADFLVPVRTGHYDLLPDNSEVDMRVTGICKECLKKKNTFQRSNTEPVNVEHKHIIYSGV